MNAQKIITNRKKNKKGGNVAFEYLKILEALPIDDIRSKCPRFNEWLENLENGIREDHF